MANSPIHPIKPKTKAQKAADRDLLRLGLRIKFARVEARLGKTDLARKAGIDRNYYAAIEAGQRNPTYLMLVAIARAMSCGVGALTDRVRDMRFLPKDDLALKLLDRDLRIEGEVKWATRVGLAERR